MSNQEIDQAVTEMQEQIHKEVCHTYLFFPPRGIFVQDLETQLGLKMMQ